MFMNPRYLDVDDTQESLTLRTFVKNFFKNSHHAFATLSSVALYIDKLVCNEVIKCLKKHFLSKSRWAFHFLTSWLLIFKYSTAYSLIVNFKLRESVNL